MFKTLMLFVFLLSPSLVLAFEPTITSEDLIGKYNNGEKIKIMIVPGHDNKFSGTVFGDTKEVTINRIVAEELAKLFEKDRHYEVVRTHVGDDYASFLKSYFETYPDAIEKFRETSAKKMINLVKRGKVDSHDSLDHVTATTTVALNLYGINKWANENDVDLLIHIHFNDYGARKRSKTGEYNGFSVYVPEKQFGNALPSIEIGQSIFNSLSRIIPESNMTGESKFGGVIEDQDLIAIGANNTLIPASVLIEYSYIYEPIIQSSFNSGFFKDIARQLAYATYVGVDNYFKVDSIYKIPKSSVLPYKWLTDRKKNLKEKAKLDNFMLQFVLNLYDNYPPEGKSRSDCPITGVFGTCTELALKDFQKKYSIPATGTLGPKTREFLNTLFAK